MNWIKWVTSPMSRIPVLPLAFLLPTAKCYVEWVKWLRSHVVSNTQWITRKLTTLDVTFLSLWRMLNKLFIVISPRILLSWAMVNLIGHVPKHGLECLTDHRVGQVRDLFMFVHHQQFSGTAAVMAKLYHEGRLPLHTDFIHESIVGTQFVGRLKGESKVRERKGTLHDFLTGGRLRCRYSGD